MKVQLLFSYEESNDTQVTRTPRVQKQIWVLVTERLKEN